MICVDSLLRQYLPAQSHWQWLRALLRRLLYENDFQQFGRDYPHLKGLDFIEQVLTYFDFGCDVSESELEHIPSQGALVLAANHPIGTLDGMALLKVVARVRPDVKIMANQMLSHVEPMTSLLFPVDVLGSGSNRQQILAMQAHLAAGKALIVFPAGEVSRLRPHGVRDGRWHTGFLRLAAKAQAPIVPLFIRGRNSPLFYLSSMVFKPLSTLLLIREMFAHRCGRIRLRIGPCIPYSAWQHSPLSLPKLAGRFRQHLYRLGKGKPGLFHTEAPSPWPRTASGSSRPWPAASGWARPMTANRSSSTAARERLMPPSCGSWAGCERSPFAPWGKVAAAAGIWISTMTTISIWCSGIRRRWRSSAPTASSPPPDNWRTRASAASTVTACSTSRRP